MKRVIISIGSAALLAMGVATASAATNAMSKDAGPVIENSRAMAAADQASHSMNMRQQLTDQLTKDGYTAVSVMPSSFFVRAKDKAGNPVAMVIGPDSFTEVTELAPKKTAANAVPAPKAAATPDPTPVPAQK